MDGADILMPHLPWIIAGGLIVAIAAIGGWVATTWLRIKNGYPLDGAWGQPLKPHIPIEERERIKLLTQENAQLRAELSSVADRLKVVERIVTDDSHRLDKEIEQLRDDRVN